MVELSQISGLLRDLALAGLGLVLMALGRLILNRVGPRLFARSELETVRELARLATQAAETMGATRGWSSTDKVRYATRVLNEALSRLGIQLTEEEVRAAIESAVLELKVYRMELSDGVGS